MKCDGARTAFDRAAFRRPNVAYAIVMCGSVTPASKRKASTVNVPTVASMRMGIMRHDIGHERSRVAPVSSRVQVRWMTTRRVTVADAVLAACMALLVWFGTGLHPWWPLMWLAPIPALMVATRSTWARTFLVAFVGYFLGSLNLWHYLHDVLSVPLLALILEFALQAALFAIVILLFRALYNREAWGLAMIALPAAWVSIEYLVSLVWVHGTAGNLAYTQLDNLPILQL